MRLSERSLLASVDLNLKWRKWSKANTGYSFSLIFLQYINCAKACNFNMYFICLNAFNVAHFYVYFNRCFLLGRPVLTNILGLMFSKCRHKFSFLRTSCW